MFEQRKNNLRLPITAAGEGGACSERPFRPRRRAERQV